MQESLPSSYHRWSKRKKENYKKSIKGVQKQASLKTKELKASNLQSWPLETLLKFKDNLEVQSELQRREFLLKN